MGDETSRPLEILRLEWLDLTRNSQALKANAITSLI